MATRLTDLQITYTKRNARARGPTSSEAWNDNSDELVRDLNALSDQWNEFLVPLIQNLPDGTGDLDAYTNGLDGRTLLVNADADEDGSYFNVGRARPYSVYEQFQAVYSYINSSVSTVQQEVDAVSISAEDIPITDSIEAFSAVTVEGALQELRSIITLASDHGALAGLSDDDHAQYLPRSGTRAMTGTLSLDSTNGRMSEVREIKTSGATHPVRFTKPTAIEESNAEVYFRRPHLTIDPGGTSSNAVVHRLATSMNLPNFASSEGLGYTVTIISTTTMIVTAGIDNRFQDETTTGSFAGTLSSTTAGSTVTVTLSTTGSWVVIARTGTWTIA